MSDVIDISYRRKTSDDEHGTPEAPAMVLDYLRHQACRHEGRAEIDVKTRTVVWTNG